MASSSSSGVMPSPRANGSSYDVFLSFRGEDTRHSFTDHLFEALKLAGILTFRDSDDAERGEELKLEIERAIKASDASIIVLSENYATSTWCLDELSLILKQRRKCNHFVLAIFYKVEPSDVGNQRGTFMIEANSSRRRWTDDNVKRWKAALTEVVTVIGMPLVGSENKFIKEVVDTIYNKLDRKQIYIPPNVTGMDTRYKEINSWLIQPAAEFLVIYGMAGSGKSTFAKYILKSNCQHFESHSIVEDIGRKCKNPHEMLGLQEKLCSDISKGKVTKLGTVCQGTTQIEVLLEKTKALVVLDDIVKERQLEDLLGSRSINKESKIIITTDNDISNWFMAKSKRYREYKMRLLNNTESLELLSLHAFRSKIPKDGYEEHAQQVVRYCEGNPTALEVLGLSLAKKHTIMSWESELRSFEKDFHVEINDVLKRSYDSLPAFEKELFLHIACFFVGKDMDYVVKILEPDYAAESKIKTLTKRCFLYVTQEKKLMMHRLLQDMGRSLVEQEGIPAKRSRVWRNKDSYEMLKRKKSSETIEGLALDIQMLTTVDGYLSRQLKELSTKSLQQMDRLKLLQLNFVKLTGSYEDFSEHLRWLCWVGFYETTIHSDIFMGNMVALDLSYSCLKEFEPPMVLGSLKILDLKESRNLLEIRNLDRIPNLETLILSNCRGLFFVCRTIGNLGRLAILNMSGCQNLCKTGQIISSGGETTQEPPFPFPHSLQRLFLNDCKLDCTSSFPLSFNDQEFLQYMNLGNGVFNMLPSYSRLKNLRVLDLRNCYKLRRLICLPSTLAELYIYHCISMETITFEFGRFTLEKFCHEGCIILSEIEGLVKLLLIAKLDETGLGHLIWLKEYQDHQMCLVGDYELTKGRSWHPQMLFEINIMSTSLPDIRHPKLTPDYISHSTYLSFVVPSCPRSSNLKGLDVTFRYTMSGENWAWFVKISKTNSEDIIYSPKVFGKPASGEVSIWLSYWPIGNSLDDGDEVKVSIVVISGLEILECGARLVYTDDEETREISENKMGWVETFGRDLSRFQLSKGSYYLCQRDFYKLMEVGKLTPGWLSIVVGNTTDDTEVRGWRMTGRPQQSYQSFKELKTGRCVILGPAKEDHKSAKKSKSFLVNETMSSKSDTLTETMKTDTTDRATKILNRQDLGMVRTPGHLTGIETRAVGIDFWLKDENSGSEVLAICGIGGSGKTTLAQYIYNSNKKAFESCSFLQDIGIHCQQPSGLLILQMKLLADILGGNNSMISNVSEGTKKIEDALRTKKVLIVLDDIVEQEELTALLGTKSFHTQSKIIITTRLLDTLEWVGSISWRCQKHIMSLLNDDESLELFNFHAFGSKTAKEGFEELSLQFSRYCEGNPLALKGLGSSLFVSPDDPQNRNSVIESWRSTMNSLNSLEKDFDSRIECVLKMSYDYLPLASQKELFLHIAIFFVGESVDYVGTILEHDFHAKDGIMTLTNRCLLSVSPSSQLVMHQVLQEMARSIVREESKDPAQRSRVWLDDESYHVLGKGEGSETIQGLALDMQKLKKGAKVVVLKTGSLEKMEKLKLLQLKNVELTGSYMNLPELRWLRWHGCYLKTIPSGLLMKSLVAIDMSSGKLEKFEPPMVLNSLRILNLSNCDKLVSICNLYLLPELETLLLSDCSSLSHLCKSIEGLESLAQLNLTGCKKLWKVSSDKNEKKPQRLKYLDIGGGEISEKLFNSFPRSLKSLYLDYCDLEYNSDVRLVFNGNSFLHMSLAGNLFEILPRNIDLKTLMVLDLTSCQNLKSLLCLPSTLKVLYIYWCISLEKITFQSARYRLRELGYEGCHKLTEIQGHFKLVSIAKINDADLGHMQWIKAYQDLKVDLDGDEITKGKIWHIQMLYEYGIRSIYLQGIKDRSMTSEYMSPSSFLTFRVPVCPNEQRIQGLSLTSLYRSSGEDEDMWVLFAKISNTTKGLTWIYNPVVYCKPRDDDNAVWLSYWPIGNTLDVGDEINVHITVGNGLMVSACGASLVYMDGKVEQENLENDTNLEEVIGGDLSEMELKTGTYFLCRRDFFNPTTPDWLKMLLGDTIHSTGWKKSDRSDQDMETSALATSHEGRKVMEVNSFKKIVLKVDCFDDKMKRKALKSISSVPGLESMSLDMKDKKLTVIGDVDPVILVSKLRKICHAEIESVGSANEPKKKEDIRNVGAFKLPSPASPLYSKSKNCSQM